MEMITSEVHLKQDRSDSPETVENGNAVRGKASNAGGCRLTGSDDTGHPPRLRWGSMHGNPFADLSKFDFDLQLKSMPTCLAVRSFGCFLFLGMHFFGLQAMCLVSLFRTRVHVDLVNSAVQRYQFSRRTGINVIW